MGIKDTVGTLLILTAVLGGGYMVVAEQPVAQDGSASTESELTAGPTNTTLDVSQPSETSSDMSNMTPPEAIDGRDVSESLLFETHTDRLAQSTFVAKYNNSINGTHMKYADRSTEVVRNGPNSTLITTDYGKQEISEWGNGSVAYKRGYGGDGTRIFESRNNISENELVFHSSVKSITAAAEYKLVGSAELHGERMFVLEAQEVVSPAALDRLAKGDELTSFEAKLYVSEHGVIRQIRFRIESSVKRGYVANSGVMEVSQVNDTTVEGPAWVASAREDAVRFNRTVTDTALAMEMENGETIPSDSTIALQSAKGAKYSVTLNQSVSEGDTLYLARSGDGEELVVSVNEKPSEDTQTIHRAFVTIKKDGIVYRRAVGFGRPSQ